MCVCVVCVTMMNLIKKLKTNSTGLFHGKASSSSSCVFLVGKIAMKLLQDAGDETSEQKRLAQVKCLAEEVQSLQNQVLFLEQELQKQKRLKIALKQHAGNMADYLKVCLEALEANGIRERMLRESVAQHEDGTDNDQQLLVLTEQARRNGWYISPYEIILGNELVGSGATSDTFKGIWHGLEVAVKCIRPSYFDDENAVRSFCQELDVLSRVRHPNVVQFLGACASLPNNAWIVLEYMPFGTLTEWLYGSKKRSPTRVVPLPPLRQRLFVALGIAQGMQYLHECDPKILHRDLKPSNMFMDKSGSIRISDFGFAKLLDNGARSALTGETGTYIYMAPEVVRHEPYDDKCDVYSFGVLLCELITGDRPYIDTHLTPLEIAFAVAQGTMRPSLHEEMGGMLSLDKALIELVMSMWDHDPTKRPSFAKITQVLKSHIPEA